MRILIIDNYDSFTSNLTQLIESCGHAVDVVKNDTVNVNDCLSYGKILISPGPGIPRESGNVCEVIRQCAAATSILGVCLGHQAIAEVFGGTLVQLPAPMHGRRERINIVDRSDYLFTGLPDEFDGGLYHSWAVAAEGVPECLRTTAVGRGGTVMALSHSTYDVKGIQFHPESVMTPEGRTIVKNWLEH